MAAITSGEIGELSFGYTGFIFFAYEYMSNIKEIDRNSNSLFIRFRRWTSPTTDLM